VKETISAVRKFRISRRFRAQYERVEKSIRAKAQLVSDLEFHKTMQSFYTERVLEIDPHVDWWDFADAKQKQHDHQMDCIHLERRVAEAEAKVEATKNAYRALGRQMV
jgi:hypothetical protein